MVSPEFRKDNIDTVINMNPIEIEINRTARIEKDGAYDTTPLTLPPQKVRIFRDARPTLISSEAGTEHRTDYFMLASAEADVKADVNNRDSFTCELGHFEISEVVPSVVKGVLCGYQCILVRVG